MLKENDSKIFVAVKTAQTDDRTSRLKILQKESEIMRGISHKNVVQMKVFLHLFNYMNLKKKSLILK